MDDPVCALCMHAAALLIARASGALLRYSLPELVLSGVAQAHHNTTRALKLEPLHVCRANHALPCMWWLHRNMHLSPKLWWLWYLAVNTL